MSDPTIGTPRAKSSRKNLTIWLAAGAIGVVLFAFGAFQFVDYERELAKSMSCANNLKQLALAIHNYHSAYNRLPPVYSYDEKGKPIHGWRPLLVGYLAAEPNFYHWEEPWDSPKNRGFALNSPIWIENERTDLTENDYISLEQVEGKGDWARLKSGWYPPVRHGLWYLCPCQDHGESFVVDYVAVVGEETAWPPSKRITFDDVTDPHDTTILFVEIDHADILWSEPRDLRFDLMHFEVNSKKGPSISSKHPGGALVAFVDGSVARLSNDIPSEIVKAMLTIAGGEKMDKEELKRKTWIGRP